MSSPTDNNPLIGADPDETMRDCANMAVFVASAVQAISNQGDTLNDHEVAGITRTMDCVEGALLYESERIREIAEPWYKQRQKAATLEATGHPYIIPGGRDDE